MAGLAEYLRLNVIPVVTLVFRIWDMLTPGFTKHVKGPWVRNQEHPNLKTELKVQKNAFLSIPTKQNI